MDGETPPHSDRDTECRECTVLQFLPSVRMQIGSNLLNDKYHG